MRRTIRQNIKTSYSLHDRRVITFEAKGDDLVLRLQSGMTKTTAPCSVRRILSTISTNGRSRIGSRNAEKV